MIKVGVVGAAGRMGKMIITAIVNNENTELGSALEHDLCPLLGQDAGLNAGHQKLNVLIQSDIDDFIQQSDIIIDFSSIESTLSILEYCEKYNKKLVIGTTGFNEEQLKKIEMSSKKIAVVFAPNMSLGVNLLFNLVKTVSQVIGETYDIEIIESHHNQKKDSPSGTAAKLAEIIADTLDRNLEECAVYGRKGLVGKRTKKEIGIHAVRAGDIVGEHTVMFSTEGERIELTHKASSRMTFAKGSVAAAIWLIKKNTGLYNMKDVLNLESK